MFRSLYADNFPPFGQLRLHFPPVKDKTDDLAEVHLFTGVNGTGKTRILSVLAAILGNPAPLLKKLPSGQEWVPFWSGGDADGGDHRSWSSFSAKGDGFQWTSIGEVMTWAPNVPAFAYSGTAYVSDVPVVAMAQITTPDRPTCLSFQRPSEHSINFAQALTNLKIQGGMEMMNAERGRATQIIAALEAAISRITSLPFSFIVAQYPKLMLRARWAGADLPFDALPDGLRSLIGWLGHAVVMMDAWLAGEGDPMVTQAVFLLDEIESPLHPAWQRRILPAFQGLFPNSQIFIATHSPFVIASLNHGWIHQLTVGPDGSVRLEVPKAASEGDSYISVVEDIMGLNEWFDPETESLLAEFRKKRDAAYHGDTAAQESAKALAISIGDRSMELNYIMSRELSQMDRQLAGANTGGK